MQVGILEDDDEQREALAALLRRHGHEPRAFASSAEVERALAEGRCPRVLLCDLDLGDSTAITMAQRLLGSGAELQLIAVTSHAGDGWVFPALAAGFVGYVLKSDAFDRLGEVVAEVEAGGTPLTREIARRVLRRFVTVPAPPVSPPVPTKPTPPALSPRESEVLQLLADGYRYEQVALRLGISVGSVRTYVQRVYGKLGVSTKSEATAIGIRRGLVS